MQIQSKLIINIPTVKKKALIMKSSEIRKAFLDYFESKNHHIVPSAPMVVKDDPTLMFTNAGMNQFKDIFLGNTRSKYQRVADSQKCLRVSGKHNDLDEVGHDTYHHTMFEMLGNWSFGDYFKKEAIEFAWELLTDALAINPENLYVTVFEGDEKDNITPDNEAHDHWKKILPEERILYGNKKDNFWEMGDTGPCGPCSEIHVDLRSDEEKKKTPGKSLINQDHPEVIEIWNLVFIEFNRMGDGKLKNLPAKHVDTGMGFERLCMVLQGKRSNYDTDVFQPIIAEIVGLAGVQYGEKKETDIAMRVVADHLRAVAFAIADGQLPSNTGAGYVIRRILRRAIRYGYTFLGFDEPFINKLLPVLVDQMGEAYPELKAQQQLTGKVITEEEIAFLRTLSQGIRLFEQYIKKHPDIKVIEGKFAFELFDTYGFPIDLTQLMASEKGRTIDMEGFRKGLEQQKERSRKAAKVDTEDWVLVQKGEKEPEFTGYEELSSETKILRYRKLKAKKKSYYEIILEKTPFYAESGGQVGDKGLLKNRDEEIRVIDTKKENNQTVHITEKMFSNPFEPVRAIVDQYKRKQTANNHSATHLLHAALRHVLGKHVEQKGSLVEPNRLRFDFAHFSKLSDEEIQKVEELVNARIRENIPVGEQRDLSLEEAQKLGAMALFGEKYGEQVRVISFDRDFSVELCGGTHVTATGDIGFFKIVSESAIAAGIRRIEAVTGEQAECIVKEQEKNLADLKELLRNPKDLIQGARKLVEENAELQKELKQLKQEKVNSLEKELLSKIRKIGEINFIAEKVDIDMADAKDLAFRLVKKTDNLFLLLGIANQGKANLSLMISESLVKNKSLRADNIIREISKEIKGGGGGQPHFATAGGKEPGGIARAFEKAEQMLISDS